MSPENWTALATVVIAIFTVVLAIGGSYQAWLTRQAIKLGRDEFIASHRPRLRVRSVYTDGLGGATFVSITNVGESTACVTGIAAIFSLKRGSKWVSGRPVLKETKPTVDEFRILKAGQRRSFMLSMDPVDPVEVAEIAYGTNSKMLVGIIRYADGLETERSTGFCWTYEPVMQEFIAPPPTRDIETEYNYED